MSEQTEVNYLDGDVVWVKLGSCWWPGEVVGHEKLPPDVLPSFRKPPIAIVKFFQEDSYEYVKNPNSIYKYDCSRKDEFIQKGLYLYRTKHGLMEKFPEDVIRAETAVDGDIEILTRDEFQETKKESYAGLFGDPNKKTPASNKKGKNGKGKSGDILKFSTPIRKVKEKSNYKVHILLQGSKTPSQPEETTPSTSRAGSEPSEEKSQETNDQESTKSAPIVHIPTASSTGIYACHACPFTTTRLNVLILHNKTHSSTFTPYTPSPMKKKLTPKAQKSSSKATQKIQKPRKPRQEKSEKSFRKNQAQKREAETEALPEVKKIKTDEEIKSSLLADWDDGDEDSNGESSTIAMAASPDVPIAAGSPAVPTPAELPSVQVPSEIAPLPGKKEEKPEASNDAKYEFCEDEDWPVEADVGRKIPRIKKPSIRKEETKSLSIDEDDMAREVAELLNKTTVPELPSVPEPLKVEENFPEPSIVKSPDKNSETSSEGSKSPEKKVSSDLQPSKTIFKTKTFFRSRHSRSQDAIGKYVAEQLNAAERHDIADSEINGSDITLSPEPRISSPIEHVKVARLAPKIQLKKMNAEAAQWREREKYQIQEEIKKTYSRSDNFCIETKPSTKTNTVSVEIENNVSKCNQEANKSDLKPLDKIDNDLTEIENDSDNIETNMKNNVIKESGNSIKTLQTSKPLDFILPEQCTNPPKTKLLEENKSLEPYMSESTASAVDALLSVSREADRVTKVISVDPPEDLFEDDIKDTINGSNINGCDDKIKEIKSYVVEKSNQESEIIENVISETSSPTEKNMHTSQVPNKEKEKEPETTSSEEDSLKDKMLINSIKTNSDKNSDKTETTKKENVIEIVPNNIPSESDLQIAEALINLPSTTIQNKASVECQDNITLITPTKNEEVKETIENPQNNSFSVSDTKQHENDSSQHESVSIIKTPILTNNIRFESEEEKSENLNAAQSLVQMSESIDHKINISDMNASKQNDISTVLYCNKAQDITSFENTAETALGKSLDMKSETINGNTIKVDSTPRLLKILEDPCSSNVSAPNNTTVNKKLIVSNKEKLLNIDVAKSALKPKPQSTKQKIIIRRTTPNKTLLNNVSEVTTPDKIILSRTNKSSEDGSSVQSYTIQTTPDIQTDNNTIIIQQKIRKIPKPNIQKIKPQITPTPPVLDSKTVKDMSKSNESVFDINSMPIVLSDDILTPESIEKMPFVMSDGNLITTSSNTKTPKGKKLITHTEKITITSSSNKQEIKPHVHHPSHDANKGTTPNILSKSSKLRGSPKPMLVIDKTTGKQQIIMAKSETPIKEVKQTPTIIQTLPQTTNKGEKFIILPSATSPRPGRTQKIVIDPQTGKAHVVVGKGPETNTNVADNKPVSAKLLPSASDATTPGNTVMIITNAQGTQSRIVLTPEHEKILFPNKQQASASQLKTITQRTSTTASIQQKNITTVASVKTPSRIVSKQKSAIITSKGQLIVGGRLATTSQNIAPLPEIRPAPKRVSTEPKKIVQAIQKNSSEPLIFLQKSGAVMQLTAAQFEHLQRTGQIIQKVPVQSQENKVIVQKTITISPTDTLVPIQKQRVRKNLADSPTPMKKLKHEIAIAPAPAPTSLMPALTPICSTNISSSSNYNNPKSSSLASASNYSNVENFEELLPTTAIARSNETLVAQTEQSTQPSAPLSDGQLLAVPGEHFGGPQGSFYLCVEDNGTFTPIDNRPLVLENNQLVPMAEPISALAPQPERRDILEAALANSDVFHAESTQSDAPDFRDLNANVSVHCRVSETSTTLNQPIMTPVEVPTKVDMEPNIPSSLDDGLAVIGVTPQTVPTSLELPITVTDPRIAPKTTDPLSNSNYRTSLLPSPSTEMTFVVTEETDLPAVGPISMPLLTEEESVGKSMPILTDEITERTISSVESAAGSPSSIDVRESETEDGSQWPRRMLTPGSDISEASVEIPLQPAIQLSVSDLSHNNS